MCFNLEAAGMIASHSAGELSCDRGLVQAPDFALKQNAAFLFDLSLIHISEPTRQSDESRMPSSG